MFKRIKEYHVELLAFISFVVYAAVLNLQFLEGSNINYTFSGHDEYIAVREVYSILNPASFKHFALAVSAGDVMFYGRAMFYTDALVAWLPYKIWGLAGMVYAIRMAHVLYLVLGVILLGRTFLSKAFSRLLFYLVVLTWYYTAYFVMIPKPEPLQLLVLAIFLFYAQRANWQYGKHFIWLGIAYGLKFNVLMILPVCFAAPFFTGTFKLKEGLISGLMLLAGIVMAVPSLILSPIRPIYIQTYLRSTFGNTSHYDDTGVPFVDWLNNGLFQWYGGHSISGAIIFMAFLTLVAWFAYRLLIKKELNTVVLILAIAFCFLMPVMLLTKRLWPHYLWTGSVFMVLALVMIFNSILTERFLQKGIKTFAAVIFIFASYVSASRLLPLFKLEEQATAVLKDSGAAQNYLKEKSSHFICVQDISVYLPFKDFVLSKRYHPFSEDYPYPMQAQVFCTTRSGFIYPAGIKEMQAGFVLTYRTNFETDASEVNTSHDKMISEYNKQMRSLLFKEIFPDTVIGKVRVYKILHE